MFRERSEGNESSPKNTLASFAPSRELFSIPPRKFPLVGRLLQTAKLLRKSQFQFYFRNRIQA